MYFESIIIYRWKLISVCAGKNEEIYCARGVNNMNDEREIRFMYSEKIDEKVFNRILELMKELIISIQEEKMNKE